MARQLYLKNPPHLRQEGAELLQGHFRVELAVQQLLGDTGVSVESVLRQAAQQPAQGLRALQLARHGQGGPAAQRLIAAPLPRLRYGGRDGP